MIRIDVASWEEAGEILSDPVACGELTLLVSIGDPTASAPRGLENASEVLRLTFSDTTSEAEGPTRADVQSIIAAAEKLRSLGRGRVLAHCAAGVSRSAAAALILHAVLLGPGQEEEAMRRVIRQRPIARPNRRMVAIADAILERDGALLRVLQLPSELAQSPR